MKKIISIFLAIISIVAYIAVPIGAVEPTEKYKDYEIQYNVLDVGSISTNENNIYEYCGEEYEFSFEAYYLKDYAPSENLILLNPTDEDVLYAAINMVENSLEYVVKDNYAITSYIVSGLKNTYHSSSDYGFSTTSSIVYNTITVDSDLEKYISLAKSITWFTPYTAENANPVSLIQDYCMGSYLDNSNRGATSITFSGSSVAINAALMTVGIYFPESCITTVGCFSGETTDTSGDIAGAYAVETYYDDFYGMYIAAVAVWDVDYTIIQSVDKSCLEAIGNITKKYNLQIRYHPSTNTAHVILPPSDSTYILTRDFSTMFKLFGSYNYAYFGEYGFSMDEGGGASVENTLTPQAVETLLGARLDIADYFTAINIFIETLESLDNYYYSNAKEAYEIINNSNIGYARIIASTYNELLYYRYSTCEARALIYQYPSTMYGGMTFQVEFDVLHINSDGSGTGGYHHVRINHNKSVVIPK